MECLAIFRWGEPVEASTSDKCWSSNEPKSVCDVMARPSRKLRIKANLASRVRKGKMSEADAAAAMARRVKVDVMADRAMALRVRPASRVSRVHRATKRRVRRLLPAIRRLHRSAQLMLKRKIRALRVASSAAHAVAAAAAGGVVRVTAMQP